MSLYQINSKLTTEHIKQLKPINYSRFRWWRNYQQDMPKGDNTLLSKIQRGEYDFSSYYWMAKSVEEEINQLYSDCYPDHVKFNERAALLKAKRKKLWEDFEKEESKRLHNIVKDFAKHFYKTKTQISEFLETHEGTLEELYNKLKR